MKTFKEFVNESKNGYWVFEPEKGFSRPTCRYPSNKYTKEEAIKHLFDNENKPEQYKEPYYEDKTYTSTIFKDNKSDNKFINWLRDNKGYDRSDDDLQSEYSASELDYLYQEFIENN